MGVAPTIVDPVTVYPVGGGFVNKQSEMKRKLECRYIEALKLVFYEVWRKLKVIRRMSKRRKRIVFLVSR